MTGILQLHVFIYAKCHIPMSKQRGCLQTRRQRCGIIPPRTMGVLKTPHLHLRKSVFVVVDLIKGSGVCVSLPKCQSRDVFLQTQKTTSWYTPPRHTMVVLTNSMSSSAKMLSFCCWCCCSQFDNKVGPLPR